MNSNILCHISLNIEPTKTSHHKYTKKSPQTMPQTYNLLYKCLKANSKHALNIYMPRYSSYSQTMPKLLNFIAFSGTSHPHPTISCCYKDGRWWRMGSQPYFITIERWWTEFVIGNDGSGQWWCKDMWQKLLAKRYGAYCWLAIKGDFGIMAVSGDCNGWKQFCHWEPRSVLILQFSPPTLIFLLFWWLWYLYVKAFIEILITKFIWFFFLY